MTDLQPSPEKSLLRYFGSLLHLFDPRQAQ